MILTRGTDDAYLITIRDAAKALVPLAGTRIYFVARAGAEVICALANTAGGGSDAQIEIVSTGVARVHLTSAITSREPVIGVCDAFVVLADGRHLQALTDHEFVIRQAQVRAFPV